MMAGSTGPEPAASVVTGWGFLTLHCSIEMVRSFSFPLSIRYNSLCLLVIPGLFNPLQDRYGLVAHYAVLPETNGNEPRASRELTPPVRPKLKQRDATRIASWRWQPGKKCESGWCAEARPDVATSRNQGRILLLDLNS